MRFCCGCILCGLTQELYECGPAADKNALIIVYNERIVHMGVEKSTHTHCYWSIIRERKQDGSREGNSLGTPCGAFRERAASSVGPRLPPSSIASEEASGPEKLRPAPATLTCVCTRNLSAGEFSSQPTADISAKVCTASLCLISRFVLLSAAARG